MINFTLSIILSLFTSEAMADVGDCAAKLVQDINYHATRAENLCTRASKANTDLKHFEVCVSGIYNETKIPPEIIAPYCMKQNDKDFRSCVITTFKSNSNDNAFKSCLKKKSVASTKVSQAASQARLRAPTNVVIDVL